MAPINKHGIDCKGSEPPNSNVSSLMNTLNLTSILVSSHPPSQQQQRWKGKSSFVRKEKLASFGEHCFA